LVSSSFQRKNSCSKIFYNHPYNTQKRSGTRAPLRTLSPNVLLSIISGLKSSPFSKLFYQKRTKTEQVTTKNKFTPPERLKSRTETSNGFLFAHNNYPSNFQGS
jgi:hypothetical protein